LFKRHALVFVLPAFACLIAGCTGPTSLPVIDHQAPNPGPTAPGNPQDQTPIIEIPGGMSIMGSPVNVDAVGSVVLASENHAALDLGLAYDFIPAPANPAPDTALYYKVAFDADPLEYFGYGVPQADGDATAYVYNRFLHESNTLTFKNAKTDLPFEQVEFEKGIAYVKFPEATSDIAVTTSAHYLMGLSWGSHTMAIQGHKAYVGPDQAPGNAFAPTKSGVFTHVQTQDPVYPVVLGAYKPMKQVSFKVKVTDHKGEPLKFLNAKNFTVSLPNFTPSLLKATSTEEGVYSLTCLVPAESLGQNYLSYDRKLTVRVGDRPGDLPL
jgi:hypothetical protein